jgi:hypothetical protein
MKAMDEKQISQSLTQIKNELEHDFLGQFNALWHQHFPNAPLPKLRSRYPTWTGGSTGRQLHAGWVVERRTDKKGLFARGKWAEMFSFTIFENDDSQIELAFTIPNTKGKPFSATSDPYAMIVQRIFMLEQKKFFNRIEGVFGMKAKIVPMASDKKLKKELKKHEKKAA